MPNTLSPSLVKTGNDENMYLPISGDVVVFPPIVETANNAPLDFNGNVVINALPVNIIGPTGLANVGLEVNGLTDIKYRTEGVRPNIAMFGSTGASTTFRGKLLANVLTASKDFELAVGVKDFTGSYNLGQVYLIDIGAIRIVWGNTKGPTATPYNLTLDFNSIPANTFDGVIGQNAQGLFAGSCLGFANINNKRNNITGNYFTYSVQNTSPGNIVIGNSGSSVFDPNPDTQFDFFVIGLAKTA